MLFGLSREFKKEVYYLKDKNYKKVILKLLDGLPNYFYIIGEDHNNIKMPEYSKGNSGKVKETKVSVRIAYELLNDPIIGSEFTDREKDLMLMSIILHDGFERGVIEGNEIIYEHPILISEYVRHTNVGLTLEDRDFICSMVEVHSGLMDRPGESQRTLPLPQSKYQKFVYMCIIMSSMRFIDVRFNTNNEIEK